MRKKLLCLALSLMLLLGLWPAQGEGLTKYSADLFDAFDTVITIIGYSPSQEAFDEVVEQAHQLFVYYHQLFDNYNSYEGVNNLYVLNHTAAKTPLEVEKPLFDLLQSVQEWQRKYGSNQVNIAMGGVLQIWHACREAGIADPQNAVLPDPDALSAAAEHMNIDDLILDSEALTVFYADPELQLDLGAVAKGYATEQVAQYLLSSSMPSFVISAGGNVRAGNPPADGRTGWGVGVQNPDGNGYLDILSLSNTSAVTSGDYQRYYMVDGVRYHHLISPLTLQPGRECRSVTVVCEDSAFADYLSTTLFLMSCDEGKEFLDELDIACQALWALEDGTVVRYNNNK